MRIGNLKDAKLIYRRRKTGFGPIPKGWKKLGVGAFRTTYLSPDRVVYKICHDGDEGSLWNYTENEVYKRVKSSKARLPKGWRVAKTRLHEFDHDGERVYIIAMEYINGEHPNLENEEDDDIYFDKIGASKAFESLGLFDLHEGNFLITPEGKKVIIDLGE